MVIGFAIENADICFVSCVFLLSLSLVPLFH